MVNREIKGGGLIADNSDRSSFVISREHLSLTLSSTVRVNGGGVTIN
jgi:hypothetical protein